MEWNRLRGTAWMFSLMLAAILTCSPAANAASTGSLQLVANGDGTVTVTGAANYDCAESDVPNYCGWFPAIYQVAASQPCNNSSPWDVGTFSQTPSQQLGRTGEPFPPKDGDGAFKMCLGISAGATRFIAEAEYHPPAPPPPPAPALPPDPTDIPTLTRQEALRVTRTALFRRLHGSFTNRTAYRATCGRLTRVRFRCQAGWRHTGAWRATVTIHNEIDPDDGQPYYVWTSSVNRPSRSPTRPTPTQPRPSGPAPSCDPAYPTVCIPNVPYDLDCPEVSATNFAVPGRDPNGFDGDGDGIGCEK